MTSCTYDVLRAAGLIPALVCRGCGNTISAHVTPWPGERYVTHPNNRCATAALREATGETNSPGPIDQERKGLPMNTTIDLKCLTRRADLLAEEASVVGGALGMTWADRLRDLGDYGRSGGSAADRRQIVETLAVIERGAVKVTGTDLFSLQVLTRDADLLGQAAKRVTTARLTWEGLATIEPTPGSFAALASMMTFIERGTVTAETLPPLEPAAGSEGQFTVTWEYTADAASAEDAAREAWQTMRGPNSIANVFTVQPKAGGEPVEIDLAAIDGHPDA